jgi:hypothetical protein
MPSGLKRFPKTGALHLITFSSSPRLPLLEALGAREAVEFLPGLKRETWATRLSPACSGFGLVRKKD